MNALPEIRWNAEGLAPVVIADATTGAVLTLAYANREALERTIARELAQAIDERVRGAGVAAPAERAGVGAGR